MLQSMHSMAEDDSSPLAIIHATAVGQDGRSSSLTAPNGPSQQQAIRQALEAACLEPHQVHAMQLHGTGDALNPAANRHVLWRKVLKPCQCLRNHSKDNVCSP